jgi:hypothetical protein
MAQPSASARATTPDSKSVVNPARSQSRSLPALAQLDEVATQMQALDSICIGPASEHRLQRATAH